MNAHTIARFNPSSMASRNGWLPLVGSGRFRCNSLLRPGLALLKDGAIALVGVVGSVVSGVLEDSGPHLH